jgi:hypothetical protein
MTHDRLVDLTTRLRQTGCLSPNEAREFAEFIGKQDSTLEGVVFRLVTQTYSLKDAERFSITCKLLFGATLNGRVQ